MMQQAAGDGTSNDTTSTNTAAATLSTPHFYGLDTSSSYIDRRARVLAKIASEMSVHEKCYTLMVETPILNAIHHRISDMTQERKDAMNTYHQKLMKDKYDEMEKERRKIGDKRHSGGGRSSSSNAHKRRKKKYRYGSHKRDSLTSDEDDDDADVVLSASLLSQDLANMFAGTATTSKAKEHHYPSSSLSSSQHRSNYTSTFTTASNRFQSHTTSTAATMSVTSGSATHVNRLLDAIGEEEMNEDRRNESALSNREYQHDHDAIRLARIPSLTPRSIKVDDDANEREMTSNTDGMTSIDDNMNSQHHQSNSLLPPHSHSTFASDDADDTADDASDDSDLPTRSIVQVKRRHNRRQHDSHLSDDGEDMSVDDELESRNAEDSLSSYENDASVRSDDGEIADESSESSESINCDDAVQ